MINQKWTNRLAWGVLIIFSIAIIVVLCIFVPKIFDDYKETQKPEPKPNWLNIHKISSPKMIKSAYMQAVATYRTIDDFTVGNPITYGIAIVTNNTDYFTEVIGVNSTDIFYSSLGDHDSQASADNLLGLERTPMKDVGYSDLFNFTHNDIFLTANGTITPVAEGEQNVTVLFFSGKHVYDGYYELRPLPISSGLSKLQAETNRSLQKEIAQTNLTNDTVLALTIVVVFAIPIGLAVEYRIERHFYELEKKDNASDSLPRFF